MRFGDQRVSQFTWSSVAFALALSSFAGCEVRYTKPIFAAEATLRVQDNKQMNQGLGMMESFGFGLMQDDIQSEIQLVQSRSMVEKAINNMNFTSLYYLVGTLVTSEIYKDDAPFVVIYDSTSNVG